MDKKYNKQNIYSYAFTLIFFLFKRKAKFDFTGTSEQVLYNWNAPRSITYSAIIYCLRAMIAHDIPLNQVI